MQSRAFISYAHVDNRPPDPEQRGWVSNFADSLEVLLARKARSDSVAIWRDNLLRGNDQFDDVIAGCVDSSDVFIAVISDGYLASQYSRELELRRFCDRLRTKGRVFKVRLGNVPREREPAEVAGMRGYDFFGMDAETRAERLFRRTREFDPDQRYWDKLADLTRDIWDALKSAEAPIAVGASATAGAARFTDAAAAPQAQPARAIYLAEVTDDLEETRDDVKRALQQHGVRILPEKPLLGRPAELIAQIEAALGEARFSVHMIGPVHGKLIDETLGSLTRLQYDLAARKSPDRQRPVVWLPAGFDPAQSANQRHRDFLVSLETVSAERHSAEIFKASVEDLKASVLKRLPAAPPGADQPRRRAKVQPMVYISYQEEDSIQAERLRQLFAEADCGVNPVAWRDDAPEMKRHHRVNLRYSDGFVIIYGNADEWWVRETALGAREFRRRKEQRPRCISVVAAPPQKQPLMLGFDDFVLIDGRAGLRPDGLDPLLEALREA